MQMRTIRSLEKTIAMNHGVGIMRNIDGVKLFRNSFETESRERSACARGYQGILDLPRYGDRRTTAATNGGDV